MKKRGIPKPYVSIQIIKNAFNFKDVIKIIMIFLSANQIKNDIKNRFLEKKNFILYFHDEHFESS